MKLEFLFAVPLALLATFVGHEALGARHYHVATSSGTTFIEGSRASDGDLARSKTIHSPAASVDFDRSGAAGGLTDTRRRLARMAPGTYIGDILAERDSSIARWPDRRSSPLRVWVQSSSRVRGFDPDFVPLVREAFDAWLETGIPLAFTFVVDSASADVHVTWVDHFDQPISGKTLWAHDADWWIVDAQIVIALHHKGGETLDPAAIHAIALHEVGHLIGLDHTADTTAIMTPRVRVKELSPADRATAQLVYMLPPGPIGANGDRHAEVAK